MTTSLISSVTPSSNPKCLIVDDEIETPAKKSAFLSLLGIPEESAIFVDNYEEALQLIQSNSDIALCFIDCCLPKNNYEAADYEADSRDPSSSWGFKLIPQIKNISIFIFSAYVDYSFLLEQQEENNNIVGCAAKPFPDWLLPKVKVYLEQIFTINIPEPQHSQFDYSSLDRETAIFVQEKTQKLKKLAEKIAQDILNIGNYLIEIKDKLGHGNFEKWLDAEFDWGRTTSYRFMRVALKFKSSNLKDLKILPTALYELSSVSMPDEVVKESIARAKKGETITVKKIKTIRKEQELQHLEQENNADSNRINPSVKQAPDSPSSETKKSLMTEEDSQPPTPSILGKKQKSSSPPPPETALPKPQILKVQQKITPKSYWHLGEHHRLFCGLPSHPLFLKELPSNLALSLNFPPREDLSLIPLISTKAGIHLFHDFENMDFELLYSKVEYAISGLTESQESLVFFYIFDPKLLELAVNLECHCYVAEPDLGKCEQIITTWQEHSTVSRFNLF